MDGGLGFWTEHRNLWCADQQVTITSRGNEKALSGVLDRYIMGQKIMLNLTVDDKEFQEQLEHTQLLYLGLEFLGTSWPEDSQAVPEQDPLESSVLDVDEVAISKDTDGTNWWETYNEIYENTTVKEVSDSYERGAVGQERFWIRQRPRNSCFQSFPNAEGDRCRKPAECLYCCGRYTFERNSQYHLLPHVTAAAVKLLTKSIGQDGWSPLPTDKIFDFIFSLY